MRQLQTFDSVLVANRGEVACRVIRTAERLGLRTVAVFSDPDRQAPHVRMADMAIRIGPAPARESYLRSGAIIEAALQSNAAAIHPGYGFLSEDSFFARSVEDAGLIFVGPTPEQMTLFAAKHTARAAARDAGVALLAGSDLLGSALEALGAAEAMGYPVMLKATGGGGGIGILACNGPEEVSQAFETVTRVAAASFRTPGVFAEKMVRNARHLEVQVVGDGRGRVATIGDRDCSMQRRNQKVLEEAPAPRLPDEVRTEIAESSAALCRSVAYRSLATVEFVYDPAQQVASFLEVNTRLQVEHTVTEEVFKLDLVEVMLRVADGDPEVLDSVVAATPRGHAVEARLCAEDSGRDYLPSPGLITSVSFPSGVRVDGWVEAGTEVSASYDSLLAKVIVSAPTRAEALDAMAEALKDTRIDGIETNRLALRAALNDASLREATHTTATLAGVVERSARVEVRRGGLQTTVQDWPGRLGYWHVGVPPSGPMDDRSFRFGNVLLGNDEGTAGLEATFEGPILYFSEATAVCVTGAPSQVLLDGVAVAMGEVIDVPSGALLEVGAIGPPGLRAAVLFAGGVEVAEHLGSRSTFTLGGFGGHGGRALRTGDVLHLSATDEDRARSSGGPERQLAALAPLPVISGEWTLEVEPGPHADDEFLTAAGRDLLYETRWEVHFNSARTGVRLTGPRPLWARTDGGEAGLHPSNIHDTPYSVGAVDFTGDVPILLGPDGPSLGGFVCPATVTTAQRWKLGQLRPGDGVRFVTAGTSDQPGPDRPITERPSYTRSGGEGRSGILARVAATDGPEVTYRANGDDNLLVEYGPMVLDLGLRARVHVLAERIASAELEGVIDLTPGVRGLQVHLDPRICSVKSMVDIVGAIDAELPASDDLEVPSREVHLPLSWDDPVTREATARYMAGVRDDAPWCPWNIEFIRRINGLADVEDVRRIVHEASYLVLGLGDVYLGAPLATPVDPRHRLVTTKYNPARTWTAENSVGIGGAYLCIYGMEGPGGYQFVGRTVQVWSKYRQDPPFEPGVPWLLRFFDRIRWFPMSAEDLLDARSDMAAGRLDVRIEPGTFSLGEHQAMLRDEAEAIEEFRIRQRAAFGVEREAWRISGEFEPREDPSSRARPSAQGVPADGSVVVAPLAGSVWKVEVRPGDRVEADQVLVILEAMKTETAVRAPAAGIVVEVVVQPGDQIGPNDPLVVLGGQR